MNQSFVQKINSGTPQIGTLVTLESPAVAEILSMAGFDWLFLDMEHGMLFPPSIQNSIQAIKGECSAVVRVPNNSVVWIKKALDTGCDGIIVPLVNTAEEATRAVRAAKYSPDGARSVGISRAQGYGMNFAEYVKTANSDTAVIIQIEHIEAVNNIDEILSVKGIGGVLIGPYDLSGSMNMLGEVASEPVQGAIRKVKDKCKAKKVPFGIFVMKPEMVEKEIQDGCSFVAVGIDTVLLGNAGKNIVELAKKA